VPLTPAPRISRGGVGERGGGIKGNNRTAVRARARARACVCVFSAIKIRPIDPNQRSAISASRGSISRGLKSPGRGGRRGRGGREKSTREASDAAAELRPRNGVRDSRSAVNCRRDRTRYRACPLPIEIKSTRTRAHMHHGSPLEAISPLLIRARRCVPRQKEEERLYTQLQHPGNSEWNGTESSAAADATRQDREIEL